MIGALVSLVLVAGASLIVGQALHALAAGAGRERPVEISPLAPAYGLAALLVLGGVTIRLPGHGGTAAVALALGVVISAAYLRGRVSGLADFATLAAPVALITAVVATLPFAIAGQVGILGAGLVNDDMASHLIIADYVSDPGGAVPSFIRGGYPIGPHAIAAAISTGTGAGLVDVFAGFTVALAPLLGLLSLGLLEGMPRHRRIVGACLIALSYLGASYLLQGAFKEPIMSILLIGTALCLGRLVGASEERGARSEEPAAVAHPMLRVLPLGVLVAGVVFVYSLPGLLWVAAVGGAIIAVRLLLIRPRPKLPDDWVRKFAPYAAGVLLILVLATAQEWSRLADFTRVSALNPERFGSPLGNLRGALSPLEVLGIWPAGDFRTSASAGGIPTAAFYLGAAVALVAAGAGLAGALRSRRLILPAATLAAVAVWGLLALIGSPYVAAKGLAIAAPLVMALAVRGSFEARRGPLLALGLVLIVGAGVSTFLVVRQAPVGPDSHADALAEVRDAVQGKDLLFLGRDDFIGWELSGSGEISGTVTNFYDVNDVRPRFKKGKRGGEKFDVDALFPRQLDKFRFVLATAGGPVSQVPPRFREVVQNDDYILYERTGPTGKRKTLDEGTEPGRVLDCSKPAGRSISQGGGEAVVWDPPPVIADEADWRPSAEPTDGSPIAARLKLPAAGSYLISLAYDSRRPLLVKAPSLGLDITVAANLDFRGETPTFPVGEVTVDGPTDAPVSVEPERPNLLARVLRAPNEAHLRELTATPLDNGAIHRVPIAQACRKYVDWYRPG